MFCKLLLVLSLILASATLRSELPELGESGTEGLSLRKEKQIGAQVIWQLRKAHAILSDPIADDYLQKLGDRLALGNSKASSPIRFFWVNDSSINAFALPGGFIGVHVGLIQFTRTENELAAVLAHEIAHVQERHVAQLYTYMGKMQWKQIASAIAAVILAMNQNGNAATGALAVGMASQIQSALNFTREHEAEADRLGLNLLAKAGFSAAAMPIFFEHLDQQHRFQAQAPVFLRSHPLTADRKQNSARLAEQYPPLIMQDSLAFQLVRARLEALKMTATMESSRKLSKRLGKEKGLKDVALHYEIALLKATLGETKNALSMLIPLHERDPHEPILLFALAEAYAEDRDLLKAIQLVRNFLAQTAAPPYLSLLLANLLLQNANTEACLKQLRDLELTEDSPPTELYYLRAKAYAALKQSHESGLAQAEYLWREGLFFEGLFQLRKVIKETNKNTVIHQQAQARLEELEGWLSTKTVDNSVESLRP